MTRFLKAADPDLMRFNLILLLLVSFLPFIEAEQDGGDALRRAGDSDLVEGEPRVSPRSRNVKPGVHSAARAGLGFSLASMARAAGESAVPPPPRPVYPWPHSRRVCPVRYLEYEICLKVWRVSAI